MSGDPEQEYFADGIVEDIITALSRFRSLFVIARNSSFTYKGKAVDVKQVGRQLGVRYVLQGSVRKASQKVRITGQLIEAATNNHLWADNFDGEIANIFELRDQITSTVVASIAPKVEQAEIARAKQKPTENLDSYNNFLRGTAALNRGADREACEFFNKAVELDRAYAAGYAMAAWIFFERTGRNGRTADSRKEGRRYPPRKDRGKVRRR
jgi:TolB-like protein